MLYAIGLLFLVMAVGGGLWGGFETSLGGVLSRIDQGIVDTIQSASQKTLGLGFWESVMRPILGMPMWLVSAVLFGLALLGLVSGARRR